ncbi:MAG: hypothetical protein M3Z32_01485 [Acidobacteriota bacterium]|nr:hypothetical protein [Acidobacteriota bacterium]
MTLNIELPPEVAARFAAEARANGVPLERHVRDWLIARAPVDSPKHEETQPARPLLLPTMRGTVIGSLHRRDIYNEAG